MYIIQTNESLNGNKEEVDFQSLMYSVGDMTWDEFKDFILHEKKKSLKITKSTMKFWNNTFTPILTRAKILQVIINDDMHLKIFVKDDRPWFGISKFYKVEDSKCRNLLEDD